MDNSDKMEKFLTFSGKLRRTANGYAITIFINDGLLEACKKRSVSPVRDRY